MEIHRSLSAAKGIRLFSAGSGDRNHASCVFARHHIVPNVFESGWLDALNAVIAQCTIDYVFPAHDDVLLSLAENSKDLKATVVASPLETCRIARSKSATYRYLRGVLPLPQLYERLSDITDYPVFAKPDRGQGSQGARIVSSAADVLAVMNENRGHIFTEYLPGEEYTVDCFSDRVCGLRFSSGRERLRTRAGISMQTRPVQNPVFEEYARAIESRLKLRGAWFFQLKRSREGLLKLLEVGPRVAGAMGMHRVLGVNFPLLSLYDWEGFPISIAVNKVEVELDRALTNRYRHNLQLRSAYVDFDDTVIVRGCLNTVLIRFLYQCVNHRVRLVLLTRHRGNLDEALKQHRISGLFDEIVQVCPDEAKVDYMQGDGAVLIDDSFCEREQAAGRGFLTFDTSMVEMLLDDRS